MGSNPSKTGDQPPKPNDPKAKPDDDANKKTPDDSDISKQKPAGPKPKKIAVQPALVEEPEDEGVEDSSTNVPRPTSAGGGDYPRSLYTSHRLKDSHTSHSSERNAILRMLEEESKKLIKKPPGAVQNSQSYSSGYEYYKNRCTARTEDELKQWFKQEKSVLQHETAEYMLKTKYSAATNVDVTRQNQLSEFKLKLSSLVNQYIERNAIFEAEKMQSDQEKNEDLLFFSTMYDRVKNGTMPRPDVLTNIDGYSSECRRKMASSSGSVASWQSSQSGVYPRPPNGYQARRRPSPINPSQLEAEASDVLVVGKQNAQRTEDVRRMERDALRNALNSRASSVPHATQF